MDDTSDMTREGLWRILQTVRACDELTRSGFGCVGMGVERVVPVAVEGVAAEDAGGWESFTLRVGAFVDVGGGVLVGAWSLARGCRGFRGQG